MATEPRGYLLSGAFLAKLRELIHAEASRLLNPRTARAGRRITVTTGAYIAKAPSGGIPARSDTTPGTAQVDLYHLDEDGVLVAMEKDPVTAVNLATREVKGLDGEDLYVTLTQTRDGTFIVDVPPVVPGECVKTIEGTAAGSLGATTPAETANILVVDNNGCIKLLPKSTCPPPAP